MPDQTSLRQIHTLLVANRGEIASRVMATAKKLGMRTVAIYSDADASALHVQNADVAVCIGAAQPSESYLNIPAIIAAAKSSGADAIHPGYGFLSENPEFVDACDAAGLVFVGPTASAMRAMGLKDAAKALMENAGVPVVPGYHGDDQNTAFLAQQADQIGYPVLIKARAGGGGKGMRKVDHPNQFTASLEAAQREGAASFADAAVLIEKYIEHPRHIEVQVFGDKFGHCVHLFERDCSLQRRHQKVIEEAPAPGMTEALRDAMTRAAVRAAQSIDYEGAGTVEFIVDASGPLRVDGFWFMEMNTRLQVEHPVTEAVTGYDLVEWQLLVAAGHPLPVEQTDITLSGHSVEARLYAEDVDAGFLPATGTLHRFSLDEDQIGRVYSGVREGDVVQPYYDPMLAKLISHGQDRDTALRQLHRMLDKSVAMGVTTNRAFLASLCKHTEVVAGRVHTGLIEQDAEQAGTAGTSATEPPKFDVNLALAAIISANTPPVNSNTGGGASGVYAQLGLWQAWGAPHRRIELLVDQDVVVLEVQKLSAQRWRVTLEEGLSSVMLKIRGFADLEQGALIQVNDQPVWAVGFVQHDSIFCRVGAKEAQIRKPTLQHADGANSMGAALLSPMPGRIIAVNCSAGDEAKKGMLLITLEAMKMEHSLIASADSQVDAVLVAVGDQVEQGVQLVLFASDK